MTTHSKIISILTAFLFVPFIVGTSPLPPPYHQYRVSGRIERQSGGPKENYVVSLVGKFPFFAPDSVVDITDYYGGSIENCVTDTGGYFFVDVRAPGKADSIAIKISAADKQSFISPVWLVPSAYVPILGENNYQEPGCRGCGSNEAVTSLYVIGYRYLFEEQHVLIPD